MTAARPARAAATTFSLMPPTGSPRPRRLISPVIAVSLRAVRLVTNETRAVNIATPALSSGLLVEFLDARREPVLVARIADQQHGCSAGRRRRRRRRQHVVD